MTDKFYDSWYKHPIDDENYRCVINNKNCIFDSCRCCEIARTYEASPNAKYKP